MKNIQLPVETTMRVNWEIGLGTLGSMLCVVRKSKGKETSGIGVFIKEWKFFLDTFGVLSKKNTYSLKQTQINM